MICIRKGLPHYGRRFPKCSSLFVFYQHIPTVVTVDQGFLI